MKQSWKKRKQGKSPKRDHQYDKQVATATTTSSKASKSCQKKENSRNWEIAILVRNVFICNFYIPVVSIVFSHILVTGEVGRKSKPRQSYEVSKKGDEGK